MIVSHWCKVCSFVLDRVLRSVMGKISLAVGLALAAFMIFVLVVDSSVANETDRRVIVNVDAGPDDAWALYHLLSSRQVKIEAISCVRGNANVTMVGRNVLRILTAMGKENEIPVFLGSDERLITPAPIVDPKDMFFGSDGFSDVDYSHLPPVNMTLLRTGAIGELAKLIEKFPSEITFISLGPLTDLALLLKVHPEVRQRIKEVLIMGGNLDRVSTESAVEFNFLNDPEGANIVVNNFPGQITVFPWETVSRDNLVMNLTWRFETIVPSGPSNPVLEILNPAERKSLAEEGNWMPCDLLVAMAFTNPELITVSKRYPSGTVELASWRGQLVLDPLKEGTGNIVVVENMDHVPVERMIAGLAKECRACG